MKTIQPQGYTLDREILSKYLHFLFLKSNIYIMCMQLGMERWNKEQQCIHAASEFFNMYFKIVVNNFISPVLLWGTQVIPDDNQEL